MNLRTVSPWRNPAAKTIFHTAAIIAAVSATAVSALAADISSDSLKFATGVTKATEGFETPPATYIVANPTDIFSDHFYYGTKVTGELKRGEKIEALAKVKSYDWILVGRNGAGAGYVPISMLSPADQYHP